MTEMKIKEIWQQFSRFEDPLWHSSTDDVGVIISRIYFPYSGCNVKTLLHLSYLCKGYRTYQLIFQNLAKSSFYRKLLCIF